MQYRHSVYINILSFLRLGSVCLCFIFFVSCNSQNIAEDVSQRQAHEIIALLNTYGITAESSKGRGSKASFSVSVRSGHYQQAISLMHEKKLPSPTEPTFEELIAQKGFIPNSKEIESLRLDHAMAREIEEVLENHPDLISVRSIVRLNFIEGKENAGASIVVQVKESSSITVADIEKIAYGVLPGIPIERISVSLSSQSANNPIVSRLGIKNENGTTMAIPLVPFFIWLVPEAELKSMIIVLCGLLALSIFVGLFIGYLLVYFKNAKSQNNNQSQSQSQSNKKLISGSRNSKQLPEV